jgi:hypothetical protein
MADPTYRTGYPKAYDPTRRVGLQPTPADMKISSVHNVFINTEYYKWLGTEPVHEQGTER